MLLYGLAGPRGAARRLEHLVVAGVLMVVVSVSWATAVSLAPAHDRPFPIGSTDGTVWNVMFVWDGLDRLNGKAGESATPVLHHPPSHHRLAVMRARARRARANAPGPTRLLTARLGMGSVLVPALVLGALGLVVALLGWLARLRAGAWAPSDADRRRWGVAAALATWLGLGLVLFSVARTLHPRYLEAFTPAVAGVFGVGLGTAVRPLGSAALAARGGRDGAAAHRPHHRDPAPGVRRPVGLRPAWAACPPPRSRG